MNMIGSCVQDTITSRALPSGFVRPLCRVQEAEIKNELQ